MENNDYPGIDGITIKVKLAIENFKPKYNMNTPEKRTKTFGEEFVDVSFNPSENPKVKEIKAQAAKLIDVINDCDLKDRRRTAVAFTNIETACMYAVKAIFTSKEKVE